MKINLLNQQVEMVNNGRQTITTTSAQSNRQGVNKIYLVVIGILGLLMSSCLVRSLHPFCFESDIVYREDILGTYTDQDKGTWTIEQKGPKTSNSYSGNFAQRYGPGHNRTPVYLLKYVDKDKKKVTFTGCLFKLDNNYYVDFYLESGNSTGEETDLYNMHVLAVHTVAKVIIGKNNLQIKWYNAEWLSELFANNKIRLAHENVEMQSISMSFSAKGIVPKKEKLDNIVLTASTEELQKFMRKFANDPKAFEKGLNGTVEYLLKRKF